MDAFKIATLAGLYALLMLAIASCDQLARQEQAFTRLEQKVFDLRLEVIRSAR